MPNPQILANAENLLMQMRNIAQAAGASRTGGVAAPSPDSGSFAQALAHSLEKVSQMDHSADVQARAFAAGDADIPLSQVMLDLQKASLAFQATVQVRNRLVEAYKEVANMAI